MPTPPQKVGDRSIRTCTWCGEAVFVVARRYSFCEDLYWDQSEHACGWTKRKRLGEDSGLDVSPLGSGGAEAFELNGRRKTNIH